MTQSVAFHSHQVIEKSLKAFLEDEDVKIPKTHDLEKLYGLILKAGIKLILEEDVLAQSNDVYIDSRYPGDTGLIPEGILSTEKANEFYESAKEIYEKVLRILGNK